MTNSSNELTLPDRVECPACGRDDGVAILYGMPAPEAIEAVEAGRIVLGGCMITENADTRHCTGCGHRWS